MIYPVVITWYIIHALFQTFLLFKYPDIHKIYNTVSWSIKFAALVIIWYKIPSFNDIFGIKKEMKWTLKVFGIALLLYAIWTVKVVIFRYDLWTFMLAQFIFGTSAGIMALILNGFIFHNPNYKHLVSTTSTTPKQRSLRSTSCTSVISGGSGNERLSLPQVLEDEQLINCLFKQLADEFLVELLLALIEFKQFHDLMVDDNQFMDTI